MTSDLYLTLGAHPAEPRGGSGTRFSVWAPAAAAVGVRGDWDGWSSTAELTLDPATGRWEGVVGAAGTGHLYKYAVRSASGAEVLKADPFATLAEQPPGNASIVFATSHRWEDEEWLAARPQVQAPGSPVSIYEVHLGSWRRRPDGSSMGYRDTAHLLIEHCHNLGFTHVELLPVMEHPFFGSWGYQVTGYFAPTSRYGTPDDFRWLVDQLHQAGIGVILDWVPAHFPDDPHGLAAFDGGPLYEPTDPREARHPEWGSLEFDLTRPEVQSFLISNARWWVEEFHADGLRVDAVASMLYRDYGRAEGEWTPNVHGGKERLEAVDFLRNCSAELALRHPEVWFVAEESTAWPGVTSPASEGGLGFTHKWDMGWMHDTLGHLRRLPADRPATYHQLTFRSTYSASERFVLPLSHDEVVHMKGSLLTKMPGTPGERLAQLRLLLGLQHTTPGIPLLFMGGEIGQEGEWNHDGEIDWGVLSDPGHRGVARWLAALHRLRRSHPALHRFDREPDGFAWIEPDDPDGRLYAWARRADDPVDELVVVVNTSPAPLAPVRVGFPQGGEWQVLADSTDPRFAGGGAGGNGPGRGTPEPGGPPRRVVADGPPWHRASQSAEVHLGAYGVSVWGRIL